MPVLSFPIQRLREFRPRLPWPAPALLSWGLAWTLLWALRPLAAQWGVHPAWPWLLAAAAGATAALLSRSASGWRRLWMALGFPLSAAVSGAASAVPAWAWLLPLALLLLAYPLRAWRDAPLFPTPADALQGLAEQLPLPPGAHLLDAGCGLGHGLSALRSAWPSARVAGIEWSWPLRLAAALRCPWAAVRQGDMWTADWSACDLVYLFQRPESMARAWAKACQQMAPGAWLLSLDFAVPGVEPTLVLRQAGKQPVWAYRIAESRLRPHQPSICAGPGR